MDPQRKWLIQIEDENGDSHSLTDYYLIGAYRDIAPIAENLADEWELKTGGWVTKLTLESHGKIKP